MQRNKLILLLVWLLACLPLSASELVPFEAHYIAYRSGMELGQAEQKLTHLGRDQYKLEYRSHASFLFLSDTRSEESLFKLTADGLIPYRYHFERSGTGKDKQLSVRFDESGRQIIIGEETRLPWHNEIDNQLYQLDVRMGLARGRRSFVYQTVSDRGEIREQEFRVIGTEELTLPYGKVSAIKVEKVREGSRRETYIWFAPGLDYQMVRLHQFKDGDEQADIQLSHYQQINGAASPSAAH
ncbi:DUF3108 domain-containing protein [Bowmanella dokdonensis]|uniref:DUF3108 domain-containing protein n=1 Tax=Bowmanella dokdonensis TaxID=751969 RepID=A0A939DKV4_9ALTE|nr:DUF3108 domain-containing protein [Bowmanella dokdonensis]MBN7824420.1 DUF3108 domain-containing protein [Bowmanella dokdonensis]